MSEKREPWVGYVNEGDETSLPPGQWVDGYCDLFAEPAEGLVPVVVTPLEEGDPRPGETWQGKISGKEYTITSAPFTTERGIRGVRHSAGWDPVEDLRPVPKLKTFRVETSKVRIEIEAESRDAALAKIDAVMEEVEDA